MYAALLLVFCGSQLLSAEDDTFTINGVKLKALPSSNMTNGDRLQLSCSADIAKTGHFQLNLRFSFYKDDRLLYNITSRNTREVYIINPIRVSMSGTYKCQVDVARKTAWDELKVRVTGVSAPNITVSKTEVKEGEDIVATCHAPEEEPPLTFTFYKVIGGRTVLEKSKITSLKLAQTVFPIEEGEQIVHFQCDVTVISVPSEGRSPPSAAQIVTVTELFSTPRIEVSPSLNFTEGRNLSVTCSVQTSPAISEEVEITIQKDKQILKSSKTGNAFYSQLATVAHMGQYTCKAELRKASKSSSIFVAVTELFPRPRLHANVRNLNLNEGDILPLSCAVPGLKWDVLSNQSFYLLKNKDFRKQMNIGGKYSTAVKEADTGSYTCEITMSNITKTSDPVHVKVHAPVSKPVLAHESSGHRMVVLGDTIELSCWSHNGTLPITYSLFRGTELLGMVEVTSKKPAVFKVNVTKSQDLVMYRCLAANRNTRYNHSSDTINIPVITPVKGVQFVTIPNDGDVQEGTELSLVCSVEGGTFPIEFHFYVKKGKDLVLKNATSVYKHHAEYVVSPFNKEEDGSYFCKASNRAQHSLQSHAVAMKAVLANWKKGVIGSFVIFIIVAVIIISLYFYLNKKKKGLEVALDMAGTPNATGSNKEKNAKAEDSYIGSVQNEDGNHVVNNSGENIGNSDVAYTEVEVDTASPVRAPVTKGTETVYSEIVKCDRDAVEANENVSIYF
ncbi:platelet endothelial cell adhesion molecule [Spea bombifrons]|uniref:platelet endothelial cell adhesion molecule n=1 Tax=Spea bombifrons TaxID=233779 RepID=UPI00234AFF92|nr:platelet endothelial cell adhesion molecule [Spea bombifrons]